MFKTIARALDPAPDAISMLKDDHRKVEGLFKQYESADDKRSKGSIARQICEELDVHAKIEESVFYPAAKREVKEARDAINEGFVEHSAVKRLVKEIQAMAPTDEMFDAKVTVLIEFVKHHVREEENEMFPKITESDLDLKALGDRLAQAKERLQQKAAGAKPRTVSGRAKRTPAAARGAAAASRAKSRGNSHARQ